MRDIEECRESGGRGYVRLDVAGGFAETGFLQESELKRALQKAPLPCSGTIAALFDIEMPGERALLKVFGASWSRHTRDFVAWAYGCKSLSRQLVARIAQSIPPYQSCLRSYGLTTVDPIEMWVVPDPFAQDQSDAALAVVLPYKTAGTVHQWLLANRSRPRSVLNLLKDHVRVAAKAILRAKELGDIRDNLAQYGFDPKPRNFLLDEEWTYVDTFPILDPAGLHSFLRTAPTKALWKRFDVRYYLFDILVRYYRVMPQMLRDLRDIMFQELELILWNAEEVCAFIDNAVDAYRRKWGHMLPDKG